MRLFYTNYELVKSRERDKGPLISVSHFFPKHSNSVFLTMPSTNTLFSTSVLSNIKCRSLLAAWKCRIITLEPINNTRIAIDRIIPYNIIIVFQHVRACVGTDKHTARTFKFRNYGNFARIIIQLKQFATI